MALLQPTLAAGLATAFAGTNSFAEAGAGWASAYATYALAAQANGIFPVFTGLEQQALTSALSAAFQAGVASEGATTFAVMELAFQAFWQLPPVAFGAGVVTLAPPGLTALLEATRAPNLVAATSAVAASNVATALDIWTRTVTVTFPGPAVATLL